MNKQQLKQNLEPILSKREIDTVMKRLNNKHLSQTESNYLSRSIRPKLKSAEYASKSNLLSHLDYRRMKYERDEKILREKILNALPRENVKAIILYGSYIRNNHTNYRDIDVMIVLKRQIWNTLAEKSKLKEEIERKININADINLVEQTDLNEILPYGPVLHNELEYSKVIYGKIELSKKITIDKQYLYRKLLENEYAIELKDTISPRYIYNAIRGCLAIQLFLKKIVDNKLVIDTIEMNIGELTAKSLLENKADKYQREIAVKYLKYLYDNTEKELKK